VRAKRQVRVLAIGSSSTVGVGASSPSATYIAKLETSLEGSLKGMDFDVMGRGLSGEVAQGAADRMKHEVEETKPDLVVWQLGTNDALRHVSIDKFKNCVKTTLAWLAENKIDVVLIDPQYGDALTKDEYYEKMVGALAEVAREMHVLLVDRFEAMRELQREHGDLFYLSTDRLHPNDRGHRCMAEQVARAFDRLYYLIYRSQIAVLQLLNTLGGTGVDIEALRPFYAQGAANNPDLYRGYAFEGWLDFMRTTLIVVVTGNQVAISMEGREFLKYMVNQGYSLIKAG